MRIGRFLPLFIVAGLALVACSPAAESVLTDSPLAESITEAAGLSDASAEDLLAELDPGVIVAAQEQVLGDIYQDLLASVVGIEVSQRVQTSNDGFGFPRGQDDGTEPPEFFRGGEGSGFIWSAEGYIVTNWHVVDGADSISIFFEDGLELDAELVGGDADSDLAVLKVDLPSGRYAPVELGDSDAINVGQFVAAIGNPFGQEFTLTSGIVSALGRTIRGGTSYSIPEVIQTDAAINPGNSGGPLLDRHGWVIGINSQIITGTGANAGIGFAIPINIAKDVVPALIADGSYDYAWLGIAGFTVRSDVAEAMGLPRNTRGALVTETVSDGPASNAGLQGSDETAQIEGAEIPIGGDIIIAADGTPFNSIDDLIAYLVAETRPGDHVLLDLIRDGEQIQIEVELGVRP